MEVTDAKHRAPVPGTPLGRARMYFLQVVTKENYVYVMNSDHWMRFRRRREGNQRTVRSGRPRSSHGRAAGQRAIRQHAIAAGSAHTGSGLVFVPGSWRARPGAMPRARCHAAPSRSGAWSRTPACPSHGHAAPPPRAAEAESPSIVGLQQAQRRSRFIHAADRRRPHEGQSLRVASRPAPPGWPTRPRRSRQAGVPGY